MLRAKFLYACEETLKARFALPDESLSEYKLAMQPHERCYEVWRGFRNDSELALTVVDYKDLPVIRTPPGDKRKASTAVHTKISKYADTKFESPV